MQVTITIDAKRDGLDIVYELINSADYRDRMATEWGHDGDAVDVELRRQADVLRQVAKEIGRQLKDMP